VIGIVLLIVSTLAAQARPEHLIVLAREGWTAARAAPVTGGTPESLAAPRRVLAEITKSTRATIWHVHGEYAHALIAAAMAAAQDEHGEMDIHLLHARSLDDRLKTSSYPAQWPLKIDEAEGELYLEVDRYADAATAFRRAGNTAAACDAYRRLAARTPAAVPQDAKDYLKRCP
jgi:hypothetical protein